VTGQLEKKRALKDAQLGRGSLGRNLIFSLLSKMNRGRLEVTLPDGSRRVFGAMDESAGADCISAGIATGVAAGVTTGVADDVTAGINVHSEEFFTRCLMYADIGLAESYLDGLCSFSSVRDVISWFLLNQNSPMLNESKVSSRLINVLGHANRFVHGLRPNSKSMSRKNISEHYDLGNEFFQLFLDSTMTYSSALFTDVGLELEHAQVAKFERIASQLRVSPGDRVLEVGCGWGGLSCYLARTFGCRVTGLTISQQQFDYATKLVMDSGLEHLVELRLEDYRDHVARYDKVVSIEMIEAVGDKYMDVFVEKLDSFLDDDGILLMQMITSADSRYDTLKRNVDFIQKHIFPGSLLPSLYRVSSAMLKCGDLLMVDLFDMTDSYVTTLYRWEQAFQASRDELVAMGFSQRFIRKWIYYFEYCQAAFDMRNVSVVQATYSRPNNRKLNRGAPR